MGGALRLLALCTASSARIIYLGYFALMESRNGQTLGKMLLKLQHRGPGRQPAEHGGGAQAQLLGRPRGPGGHPVRRRLIGSLAELAIVIVIAVTIGNSPTKQGWHDGIAGGTKVIKIG